MGLSNVLLEVTDPTYCNVATLLISVATKGFYISPRLSPTIFFHRDASSAILHLGNRCDRGLNFTYYTPVLVSRFIPLRKPEYKEGIMLLSRIELTNPHKNLDYYYYSNLCLDCLKKNQNTPGPSEHPPVMGKKMSKRLGGIKGCKIIQNLFMAFKQVPRCR